ncbi:anti-sigma factor [Neolewinella antarctica]|uniref:Anti-sigma factor RsiW n=1 Tax=Neolewinella antarctica TaxID=442734 RepID=A0ABX0XDF4_9BACT|nr:hypothetical protein [Neolewinella antarctica]NJC27339.1 anti-sigma factor RsiW [Neolewinella antarctica]
MTTTYLVGAVVAAIVYYIGKEVVGSFAHVPDKTLVRFWNGELKRTESKAFRRATEHLATCEACRDRLDEMRKTNAGPGAADPLISRRY